MQRLCRAQGRRTGRLRQVPDRALTAAKPDEVVDLFTPDALFWGTTMRDLATTKDGIRQYFSGLSNLKPNELKASALGPSSALVLSDTSVLVSGM